MFLQTLRSQNMFKTRIRLTFSHYVKVYELKRSIFESPYTAYNDVFPTVKWLIEYLRFRNTSRVRHIECNTGKSAREGNLRHPRVRFQSFADEARRVRERLKSYPSWHQLYSMHLPVKRTWFFCLALVQDKKISHR